MKQQFRVLAQSLVALAALVVLIPATASAQSGFVGVVRDASGAVLPGVNVEAASEALIEKVRSTTTDGQGAYRIVDLRPGTYLVTFTLPGFTSVKRDGVVLPASFTATLNVDMKVGNVEETVTVTGASPTVDVANVATVTVHDKAVLDALPVTRSPQAFTQLTVGVTSVRLGGVGGGREELATAVHGSSSSDSMYLIDGQSMSMYAWGSGGAGVALRISESYVSEISVQSSGGTVEQMASGMFTNVIPREGGNRFTGGFFGSYVDKGFQRDNLSDKLRADGLTTVSAVQKLWDVNPSFGGPLVQDKLWFFGSLRQSTNSQTRPGFFKNLTPTGWKYTPDLTSPDLITIDDDSYNLRLTWQLTPRNKFSAFADYQPRLVNGRNYQFNVAPEATTYTPYIPNTYSTARWTSPVSSHLFLESGFSMNEFDFNQRRQPGVGFDVIPAVELSTGTLFRSAAPMIAGASGYGKAPNHLATSTSAVSYVTGSHAVKVGFTYGHGWSVYNNAIVNRDMGVSLRNGAPASLTLYATPTDQKGNTAIIGLYAQDAWRLNRLTVTGGLRYDQYKTGAGAASMAANEFVGAAQFAADDETLNWKDVSPRLAVALDLFGNAKTAVKGSIGRYMSTPINPVTLAPLTRTVASVTRTWTDANQDFSPDCVLANPLANGECGQISNLAFGANNPNATIYSDDYLFGSGKRLRNWEGSLSIQQELAPRVSATVAYYHRWWQGFTVNDNSFVTPADYDPYCITTPADSRLPGGGGQQLCGLADIKPALFGRSQVNIVPAEKFGNQSQVYDGFDVKTTMQFGNGAVLSGGMNIGREVTDRCFVVDSPQELLFCKASPPFQANFRFYGVYPLPGGFQASAVFQALPGRPVTATYQATSAQIAPSLGRNLSSGASGLAAVPLIQPGSVFSDPSRQLDVRVAKRLRAGGMTFLPSLDLINLTNAAAVQDRNFSYGTAWLRPLLVQSATTLKLSVNVDF